MSTPDLPVAPAVTVAAAVKAWITSAPLTERAFTLERSYGEWDLDLKELDGLVLQEAEKLRIDVVPQTVEQELALATRGSVRLTIPIDVAVRKKFGPSDRDEAGRLKLTSIDPLMLLMHELAVAFSPIRMADFQGAVWDEEAGGTKILASPLKSHLREAGQFTGILRIYFRVDVPVNALPEESA